MKPAQPATDHRLLMPKCSAFIDAMKDAFGEDQVHVKHASENGISIGREGQGEPVEDLAHV